DECIPKKVYQGIDNPEQASHSNGIPIDKPKIRHCDFCKSCFNSYAEAQNHMAQNHYTKGGITNVLASRTGSEFGSKARSTFEVKTNAHVFLSTPLRKPSNSLLVVNRKPVPNEEITSFRNILRNSGHFDK